MEWGVFETPTQVHVAPSTGGPTGAMLDPHEMDARCYCHPEIKAGKLRDVLIHKVALTNQVPSSDNMVHAHNR